MTSTIFLPSPLGLDDPVPTTDFLRETSKTTRLKTVLKALPRKEITDQLLVYFQELAWITRVIHYPYFDAEYAAFWQHLSSGGDPALVDPAWMAILFIMVREAI